MLVFEMAGALMIILSLGVMMTHDTRDTRIRVTR
jgi:hypothetical protein